MGRRLSIKGDFRLLKTAHVKQCIFTAKKFQENTDKKRIHQSMEKMMDEMATVKLATRKQRFFACLIDIIIIALFGKLLGFTFKDFFIQLGNFGTIIGFIVVLFYFGLCNSRIFNGQTVGKKILHIHVVNRNSEALSVPKGFLRALCFAIFILMNGASFSSSDALIIILNIILFSIPVLEIYFIIVNQNSKQALHDLFTDSFVVSTKSEGYIDRSNKKSSLYAAAIFPVLIFVAITGLNTLVKNTAIEDMTKTINTIYKELPVSSVSMYRNTTTKSTIEGTSKTKSIEVTAVMYNKNNDENMLATKIAEIIFDSKFTFEKDEILSITFVYGYDIGIAKNFEFKVFTDSVEQWKKFPAAIHLLEKIQKPQKNSTAIKDNFWRYVAGSQYIVSGMLNVDTNKINEIKRTKSNFIEIHFSIDSVFKGDIFAKEITLRKKICDSKEKKASCNDSNLFAFNGQRIIAPINFSHTDSTQFAFAGSTANSIMLETEENKAKVINEIAKQKNILDNKAYAEICSFANHSSTVKNLIEDMLVETKATEAYAKLEELGLTAIPATICQMDDRRELAIKEISLKNKSPETTEVTRRYTPHVVADVLAAILAQVARNEFGFISNGASEEERIKTINGWRIYLWYAINE